MFAKWDKIWFDDCVVQGSKLADEGYMLQTLYWYELIEVDENTVALDPQESFNART